MYTSSQKRAYNEGFDAFTKDGQEYNPYSKVDERQLHEMWNLGYNAAFEEFWEKI